MMTAIQSLNNPKLFWLDIFSGLVGVIIVSIINQTPIHKIDYIPTFFVLCSRVIVDLVYYLFISKSKMFGESLSELVSSMLIWILINISYTKHSVTSISTLIGTTIFAMFFISKLMNVSII